MYTSENILEGEIISPPEVISCPNCQSSKWEYNRQLTEFITLGIGSFLSENGGQTREEFRCYNCGKKAASTMHSRLKALYVIHRPIQNGDETISIHSTSGAKT